MNLLIRVLWRYLFFFLIERASTSVNNRQEPNSTSNPAPIVSESIQIAALGRVAALGDLYDAAREKFVDISIYEKNPPADLVQVTDNAYSDISYVRSESLSEKMDKLGISGKLSVSIMAGMVKVSGSGKYLNEEKKRAKSAKASLIYSIRTVRESLKIFYQSSRELMDEFLRENIEATHVVVGLEWGANVILSIEETSTDSSNVREIQGKLEASLKIAAVSVSGSVQVDVSKFDVEKSKTFRLRLNGDIVPSTVPQTMEESIKVIRNIPSLIKSNNNGKGKIINLILMPLDTVRKYFKFESQTNKSTVVNEIEQGLVNQFMEIFQDMKDLTLTIDDVYNDMRKWALMVPKNQLDEVSTMKNQFDIFVNEIKAKLAEQVVKYRKNETVDLMALVKEYKDSNWTLANVIERIKTIEPTMRKIRLLYLFESFNSYFVDSSTEKHKILAENYRQEIRIILVDLNIDISSVYVHTIVKLLEIEAKKQSGAVKYYIEHVTGIINPRVDVYFEGNVTSTFPVDSQEYLVLIDDGRRVVISNGDSYDQVAEYFVRGEEQWYSIAVVNNNFYVIDTIAGTIKSIGVSSILTRPENNQKWKNVGSFPAGTEIVRMVAPVIRTAFFFMTRSPNVLYMYETLTKMVKECIRGVDVSDFVSLAVANKTLYFHSKENFYSYNENQTLSKLEKSNLTYPALFTTWRDHLCSVGGVDFIENCSTSCYPVNCYTDSEKKWTKEGVSHVARWHPAIATTRLGTGVLVLGGLTHYKNGTSIDVHSAELSFINDFRYVPKPSERIGGNCTATTIYV